jgi:hypothetical protein
VLPVKALAGSAEKARMQQTTPGLAAYVSTFGIPDGKG